MRSASLEGAEDAGFEDDRNKVQFSTMLHPKHYERLRAASDQTRRSIASIVESAVEKELARVEEEEGPIEVQPYHKVKSS